MAHLYLDNDVSLRLVPLLLNAGHDVRSANDLALTAATDDEQLLVAVQSGWTLVTHNRRDFTLLHDAWHRWPAALGLMMPPHPGILVLDQAVVSALSDALNSLLAGAVEARLPNELYWWRMTSGWSRRVFGSGWFRFG